MKKFGFTMAEVLITLGIIGVVATITLPTVIVDARTAQLGPKLATAASTFEQANQALLDAYNVDKLSETGLLIGANDPRDYIVELLNHMKGTRNSVSLITKSGVTFTFPKATNNAKLVFLQENETAAHKQRLMLGEQPDISVEVNGQNFAFSLWNDGSLKAKGSTGWNASETSNYGGKEHWKQKCTKDVKPGDEKYTYCTGSIFENNMKLVREKSQEELHF
ncbi:type II secretion system protein [bacterium]|nr:type II secretion system protein [bacterium]